MSTFLIEKLFVSVYLNYGFSICKLVMVPLADLEDLYNGIMLCVAFELTLIEDFAASA